MRSIIKNGCARAAGRGGALSRRWARDQSGFSAVEFAIVSVVFVPMLLGVMSVSLYFFTLYTVTNGMVETARGVRTGQFQQGVGAYTGVQTLQDRESVFRAALCAKLPAYVDCSDIVILAQANNQFGGITQPVCAVNGQIVTQGQADATFDVGQASAVVLMTACYPWSFGGHLPFIMIGNLSDGSFLVQASVIFRTEPYT